MKKRILSGILFGFCVLMTLVLLSAAAADTNPPQKLGDAPEWEATEDVIDVFNVNKQMQIGENLFEVGTGKRKNLGFTPTESGYYAIYSVGTYDTYGMLRDPNLNVYAEDDDSGENYNFRMVFEMTANTPYIVGVQFYSQSASGTVTVVLEKLVNPCGDNLTWSFDAPTGTLTITGSGMMWPFDDGMPWAAYTHDITSVSLPDGIASVAPFAFAACDHLRAINIPATLTNIGDGAFMGCRSLMPDGITIDENNTAYYINSGVLYFRGEGWGIKTYLASNIAKTYKITGNMDAVDNYAFADCDYLEAVTIDDVGLYDINEGMFMDCSSLEYAGLFNVDRIDKNAFRDCTSLQRIVITTELDLIGANAFVNCNALSHVYYLGTEAERNANLTIESTGNQKLLNATWHYVDDVSTFMCGDYLFWYYNSEIHALAIEGAGDMWDFEWKASPWFDYNDDMQVAVIDSDVTRIGSYAFMNCSEIVGFTLPRGLESIGANAFENNHTMTEIDIPASVKAIEEYAFTGCDVLETVTLHEGLLTIGKKAFFDCWELEAFHIPASVTSIGVGAFRSCSALTAENFSVAPGSTSYRVEDGVLFTYDRDLLHTCLMTNPQTEYTVPEDVTEIADFAFEECDALVTVRLPRWLYVIGEDAFSGCENLATVNLPANLTAIGENAFSGTAIRIVRIPKNVTRIEPWTFSYCSSLTTIEIPKTVTYIGKGAFHEYHNAITDVYYTGTETERNNNLTIDNADNYNDDFLNATWHYETSLTSFMCGDDLYWEYDSRNRWLGIHGTGDMWDFPYFSATPWESYRTSVRSILIANSSAGSNVTSIGDFAFDSFTRVTSFTIPSSVQRIGICAVADCTALTSVTLPNGLVEIDTSAFRGCTNLAGITLPGTLRHIGSYAFAHCSSIPSVTIPASVIDIEETAFTGMDALPAFTVEAGNPAYCAVDGVLFTIDRKTLMQYPGGNSATSYEIPDGVEYVAEDAFAFNKHLNTVDIPDTVTDFGSGVFACCEALECIILPDSISGVSGEMFTNCPVLEAIILPGTVTFVGDAAFYGCTALSDVYFIGTEAMRNAIEFNVDNECLEDATWHYIPIAFRSQALTLEGRIGVNFFIDLPQDAAVTYEGVEFTIDSIDGASALVPFMGTSHPKNGSGYYEFTYYVRTIEMANTITATLRYTLNGKAGTLEKTYSVKQYFETFDQYMSLFTEKQKNMVKATADLGHYVQAFLAAQKGWTWGTQYEEMAKHYADYTPADVSAAETALAPYAVIRSTGTNMQKITYSLVLDSDTELLVYFKPASGYTGTFTFTVNGTPIAENGEKISVALQPDGRYMVSVKNIAAHELSSVYVIKALSGGDEASITVSALSYANAMITGYANDAAWVNAAVAIYRYAAAAEAMRN